MKQSITKYGLTRQYELELRVEHFKCCATRNFWRYMYPRPPPDQYLLVQAFTCERAVIVMPTAPVRESSITLTLTLTTTTASPPPGCSIAAPASIICHSCRYRSNPPCCVYAAAAAAAGGVAPKRRVSREIV